MKTKWRGVIFDMDGTLTIPVIDFAAMRQRLNILNGDILHTIRSWPKAEQSRAFAIIEKLEADARAQLEFQPGIHALMGHIDLLAIPTGIITRNTRLTVEYFMNKLNRTFDAILTREFEPVKPAPDSALWICRKWKTDPASVLMVGDYRDDILCGKAAGTRTCLLLNERNREYADLADFVVDDLSSIIGILS